MSSRVKEDNHVRKRGCLKMGQANGMSPGSHGTYEEAPTANPQKRTAVSHTDLPTAPFTSFDRKESNFEQLQSFEVLHY